MIWLILGLFIWIDIHLIPILFPALCDKLRTHLGKAYQGLFALAIVAGVILIVVGWRNTLPLPVYDPPSWGKAANMVLMFVAILLLGAGSSKGISRIKQYVRHPMLTGVMVWSIGHLLANGDIRSIILFASMGIWAVLSQVTINQREGAWQKPTEIATMKRESILLAITVVVYLLLFSGHRWFAGVAVV